LSGDRALKNKQLLLGTLRIPWPDTESAYTFLFDSFRAITKNHSLQNYILFSQKIMGSIPDEVNAFFSSSVLASPVERQVFCFSVEQVPPPPRLKTETDPVSETLCFLFVEIRTMDKVQKLNSNEHSFRFTYNSSSHATLWSLLSL
jgi:hypothetical protein